MRPTISAILLLATLAPAPALRASASDESAPASTAPAELPRYAEIRTRGEAMEVDELAVRGKRTIVSFSSFGDSMSRFFDPFLQRMADLDPGLVVRVLDVDRPGHASPDLESPVALRYRLKNAELPMVRVYDHEGRLEKQGKQAMDWVEYQAKKLPPPTTGRGPYPISEMQGEVSEITNGNPVDFNSYLSRDKKTVVMFHSPFCPPCRKIRPMLEELAEEHKDYVLRKVDVNRPGTWGIDYRSPVGTQYGINMLPFVLVFDEKQHLRSWGQAALMQLITELNQMPETGDR